MLYPLMLEKAKVQNETLPLYTAKMITEGMPYCPTCGLNTDVTFDRKGNRERVGYDLIEDQPSKITVTNINYYKCTGDHRKQSGNRRLPKYFEDPWVPFGGNGRLFSEDYYGFLVDKLLFDRESITTLKKKYLKEISEPILCCKANCREAIASYIPCDSLFFFSVPYDGTECCFVLGNPIDEYATRMPVLLYVANSVDDLDRFFLRRALPDRLKQVHCKCSLNYAKVVLAACKSKCYFIPNSRLFKDIVFCSEQDTFQLIRDVALLEANSCKERIDKEIRQKMKDTKKLHPTWDRDEIEEYAKDWYSDKKKSYASATEHIPKIVEAYMKSLFKNDFANADILDQVKISFYKNSRLCGKLKYSEFATDFPNLYALCLYIEEHIGFFCSFRDNANCFDYGTAEAVAKEVIRRLNTMDKEKVPYDVAFLTILFNGNNFRRRLDEHSPYAQFIRACFNQQQKAEKARRERHKKNTSAKLSTFLVSTNNEGPESGVCFDGDTIDNYFADLPPWRELEYYIPFVEHAQSQCNGDLRSSSTKSPSVARIPKFKVSTDITPWTYPPIWVDCYTVIDVDLEKI